MLDVDYGSYPYTTSSHTISGGATIGLGIGPNKIDEIIGVIKAYTTRVGEGPMPTELNNDIGMHLSKKGHEYGTTTNRPRRCGWLDLVVIRHSCMISGITKIALTKLDVLSKLKKIKICTSYNLDDKNINYFPSQISFVERCQPVYEEVEGWDSIDKNLKKIDDLPKKAVDYVKFIEKKLNIPVSLISIGPSRNETIVV
jgi:adenylosuccinate synthase